jgi:hypothetical protein
MLSAENCGVFVLLICLETGSGMTGIVKLHLTRCVFHGGGEFCQCTLNNRK